MAFVDIYAIYVPDKRRATKNCGPVGVEIASYFYGY